MPHITGKTKIDWHYDIEGEGVIVIFIHGWGVDKRIWRQQSKYFSDYYKVVTVDLPGHGKSGWENITLGEMADDLAHCLNELGIHQATVIGSSLGGLMALKLYEVAPTLVQRMIFVGSMPKFAQSEGYPHGLDVGKMRKLSGQVTTDYPSIVNVFFRSLFTKEERQSRRFKWLQKFRQTDEAPIKQALLDYLDILEHEDLRAVLKEVKIPIQFINGREDEICTRDTVEFLRSLQPFARYDFFERCGHFPFLSKPYEFNALVEEFLKESTL